MSPPTTGIKISAMNNDAVSVNRTVIGRNLMNSPMRPAQNSKGINTLRVVAVEATMGQAMRLGAKA